MTVIDHPLAARPAGEAHPAVDHLLLARQRLHDQYDEPCGAAEVDRAVDLAAARLTTAPVDTFVPLLVERAARAHLTAELHRRAEGVERPA